MGLSPSRVISWDLPYHVSGELNPWRQGLCIHGKAIFPCWQFYLVRCLAKAAVVRAITHGLLTWKDALDLYGLSDEELQAWHAAVERHGEVALKATTIRRYRQP